MNRPTVLAPTRYTAVLKVDPSGGIPSEKSQIPPTFSAQHTPMIIVNKSEEGSMHQMGSEPSLLFYFGVGILALVVIRLVVR